jgi:hypothetical protein
VRKSYILSNILILLGGALVMTLALVAVVDSSATTPDDFAAACFSKSAPADCPGDQPGSYLVRCENNGVALAYTIHGGIARQVACDLRDVDGSGHEVDPS